MSDIVTLTLRAALAQRIEVDGLTADRMSALGEREIAELPVFADPDCDEVWVWVVRPRPTAAPRALTTLSPARPACRRRLRLMLVMAPRCARVLCGSCEGRGWVVSVT